MKQYEIFFGLIMLKELLRLLFGRYKAYKQDKVSLYFYILKAPTIEELNI